VTKASSVRTSGKSIVRIFEGILHSIHRGGGEGRGGGGETERALTLARTGGGLILNPGVWRVLDETRRVLATPDGTDALSDVKLKHAALTRRFDDTPYNLASRSPAPSRRPLGTTGFLPLPPADSLVVPRPSST